MLIEPLQSAPPAKPAATPLRPPLLDAGWLLLIPGILLVAFTILLPALDDLDEAAFFRDRLTIVEKARLQRAGNYHAYLDSLNRGDESTILALAALQLNKAPDSRQLLISSGDIATRSASVFPSLEPAPPVLPERHKRYSTLERLARDPGSRSWLLAGGAIMIFAGLLPAGRKR